MIIMVYSFITPHQLGISVAEIVGCDKPFLLLHLPCFHSPKLVQIFFYFFIGLFIVDYRNKQCLSQLFIRWSKGYGTTNSANPNSRMRSNVFEPFMSS